MGRGVDELRSDEANCSPDFSSASQSNEVPRCFSEWMVERMPTEPLSVLVYVLLLLPGLVFLVKTETYRASLKHSAFRETATVVILSSICVGFSLLLLCLWSFFDPIASDLLSDFVASPRNFVEQQLPTFVVVLLATLLVSCATAYLLAGEGMQERFRELLGAKNKIDVYSSSWDTAFRMHDNVLVDVGIQLKSGAWVSGNLFSFDPVLDGIPHRSLVLSGDVRYRHAAGLTPEEFVGYHVLTVDSEAIEYMAVGYQAKEETHDEVEAAGNPHRLMWVAMGLLVLSTYIHLDTPWLWLQVALQIGMSLAVVTAMIRWQRRVKASASSILVPTSEHP